MIPTPKEAKRKLADATAAHTAAIAALGALDARHKAERDPVYDARTAAEQAEQEAEAMEYLSRMPPELLPLLAREAPPDEPRLKARKLVRTSSHWRQPDRWSDFGKRVRAAAIACGAVVPA